MHPWTKRDLLYAGEWDGNIKLRELFRPRRIDNPEFVFMLESVSLEKREVGYFEPPLANFMQRQIGHGVHVHMCVPTHRFNELVAPELNAHTARTGSKYAPLVVSLVGLRETEGQYRLELALFLVQGEEARVVFIFP